jgi:hypothetical protein
MGDARATWEVLREVLGCGRGKRKGATCVFFRKDGVGLTDKGEIAEVFCEFYSQVGAKAGVKNQKGERGVLPGLHGCCCCCCCCC